MVAWTVEWLVVEESGERRIPAFDFLNRIPVNVRVQMLAILDAVRTTGPDQWADPQSHCAMKGSLSGLHEVRDKHDQTLYRLFVRWDRNKGTVVVVDGRKKSNNTALSDAEYEAVALLASTLDEDPQPLATVDDFVRLAFDDDDDA